MRRAILLALALLVVGSSLSPARVSAYLSAGQWGNSNSFSTRCLGYDSTLPASQMDLMAVSGFAMLGFYPNTNVFGASFTRSNFLDHVQPMYGVFVTSHGDIYNNTGLASFWADPGSTSCTSQMVTSADISARTYGTGGAFFNFVFMSTCFLGNLGLGQSPPDPHHVWGHPNMMPEAFGIHKVKNSARSEFYLGYLYEVYLTSEADYESNFWAYAANSGYALSTDVTLAFNAQAYAAPTTDPFLLNWFGNPNYNGRPKTS